MIVKGDVVSMPGLVHGDASLHRSDFVLKPSACAIQEGRRRRPGSAVPGLLQHIDNAVRGERTFERRDVRIEGRLPDRIIQGSHFPVDERANRHDELIHRSRVVTDRAGKFEIVFLDGEAVPASGGTAGSHALASRVREGGASHVRLIVFLDRVGDADLQIARDLMSHRFYREQFWEAAAELERLGAFPSDAAFETAGSVHQAFLQIGFRPVVSLSDTTYGGEPPPGPYTATEADTLEHCAPGSLETVGIVVLQGLDSIAQRLAKIDRFASSPGSVLVTDAEAEAQPATDAQAVESLQNDGQGAGSSPHSVEP